MKIHAFKTKWGWCGIAACDKNLCRVIIPGRANRAAVLGQLKAEFPDARRYAPKTADTTINTAADALKRYFSGEPVAFDNVALALEGLTKFQQQVLNNTRKIPYGKTMTYGDIARRCNRPLAARAVGATLKRNPLPVIVPCHRVVASSGPGGFSAGDGTLTKLKLIALEQNAAKCQKQK